MSVDPELIRVAHDAADEAVRYLREAVSGHKRIEYKSDIDLVTDTDHARRGAGRRSAARAPFPII